MQIEALDTSEDDDGGWNIEGSGLLSVALFGTAIQVWCFAQPSELATVNQAALAFNVSPDLIRQAVDAHYWMYLAGDQIEHEGE